MTPPRWGSLTDVPGIRVGSATLSVDGRLTGVTVVLPPAGTVGAVDVRGGGPGTHETDALDPSTLVPTVDAVVLTGGVGENAAAVRSAALRGLSRLGIEVDEARNIAPGDRARAVSPDGAEVAVLVVPTNEEWEIATQALELVAPEPG